MQCERCRSYAINPGQNGRGDNDLHLCDVCYWRARAEAKQVNTENKAERLTGHQFQGRLDRWCEICALPDRHPIHQQKGERLPGNVTVAQDVPLVEEINLLADDALCAVYRIYTSERYPEIVTTSSNLCRRFRLR